MTRRLALTIAIYLGTFMVTLDISIVNLALPRMQQSLQTDMAGLQWIVDSYALCLSAFMLSAGLLGDRYGRKKSWLLGVLAFTVGSMMCALAGSLSTLLWGRVVQGMAGALLIPGALSILTHAFPDPAQRARVIGGWSSFSALALVLGPILGGVLVDVADWPSIFSLNLPLGLLTLGLGMWGIQESANPEHAAFDLVAYRDSRFLRVQVKFRAARPCGSLVVQFRSNWTDRHGTHKRPIDRAEVDLFCVYCPDTDECYYLRPRDYDVSATLRISPSGNNQRAGVWFASDFREIPSAE